MSDIKVIEWKGGRQLTSLYKDQWLSRAELSRRSGVSYQHIHSLETGKMSNPSIDTVKSLASVLGVRFII